MFLLLLNKYLLRIFLSIYSNDCKFESFAYKSLSIIRQCCDMQKKKNLKASSSIIGGINIIRSGESIMDEWESRISGCAKVCPRKIVEMMGLRSRATARSKIIFDIGGRVRFQAGAWELHRFEPVPDFRINEVNYSSGLRHASKLQSPSLLRVLLMLSDEWETCAIEPFRLTTCTINVFDKSLLY